MGCLLSGVPRPARLTWPWLGASRVPGPLGDKRGAPSACPARAGLELQVPTPPLGPARPTWPNFLSIKGEVWERPGRGRWPHRPGRRRGLPGPPPPCPSPQGAVAGLSAPGWEGGIAQRPGVLNPCLSPPRPSPRARSPLQTGPPVYSPHFAFQQTEAHSVAGPGAGTEDQQETIHVSRGSRCDSAPHRRTGILFRVGRM